LLPVHGSLPQPWVYHYPRLADDDPGTRIAFAELIGPDGPLEAPDCRVGFTVMAEATTYPLHYHPAVELYWVIAGNAQWQTPTSDRIVPPGDLVLHRSNEPHAMRTFDEPLLALWGWTGEIDAPAIYLSSEISTS
jgi:quercetin dioxygenase-like cupin family protein